MNREIKFRAWDVKKKQMIAISSFPRWGFINPDLDTATLCAGGGDLSLTTNPKHYIWMEYTGLKDKNGVEIFEGDVLDGHSDGLVKVVWRGTGWECDFDDEGNIGLDEMCLWFGGNKTVEVIGNIYENPDLVSPAPDSNSDRGKGDEIVNEQTASMA